MPRGQYERRSVSNDTPAAEAAASPIEAVSPALNEQTVSNRAVEMRRERRRRNDGDLDGMAHLKLAIPREIQEQGKREGKVFRYFLETNVPGAYSNDWDVVDGPEQILANPNAGEQTRLVLCSKYKDWHDADTAKNDQQIDEREQAMLHGQVSGDGGSSTGLVVPKGQVNRVSRQQGL